MDSGLSAPRERNDCVVRAMAAVTDLTYDQAHALLARYGRRNGGRMRYPVWQKAFADLGYTLTDMRAEIPGATIVTVMRSMWARPGRYLVHVRGHVMAVVHGKAHDWADGRRHRVKHIWQVRKAEAA